MNWPELVAKFRLDELSAGPAMPDKAQPLAAQREKLAAFAGGAR